MLSVSSLLRNSVIHRFARVFKWRTQRLGQSTWRTQIYPGKTDFKPRQLGGQYQNYYSLPQISLKHQSQPQDLQRPQIKGTLVRVLLEQSKGANL